MPRPDSMSSIHPAAPLVRELGRADYEPTFAAMRAFTDARTPETRDELWIVEHPPVFTLGLGADPGHVLAPHGVPVVQTDRGGEVTYHGPGQVVIYLLMDLRRNKPGGKLYARQFVEKIEQAVIDVLGAYNLAGERIAGAPGIRLDLLDLDAVALAAVGEYIAGARRILGTSLAAAGAARYHAILSNPPLHRGATEDHALLHQLIADAPRHLVPGGVLQIVVQRRVPLDQALVKGFATVTVPAENSRYRVWRARTGE